MENLVIDGAFWTGKRVFLTGHTGFKGGWTALLLHSLGARVHGYSRAPEQRDGIFAAAAIDRHIDHRIGDVTDGPALADALAASRADIVLHMAAQALVRRSYQQPVDTYLTNVMGTVHMLEAVRRTPSVRAVVIVSSDKCYENASSDSRDKGFSERDRLGGADPYSNSKACTELVVDAYRHSFFRDSPTARIASARAGNVIGGGDWAEDRLVPDAIRAFAAGLRLSIRNPQAVRPWQHALDPILGYLKLAQALFVAGEDFAESWNFGPGEASEVTVGTIADKVSELWGNGAGWDHDKGLHPHEAACLKLDCAKARRRLGWAPAIPLDEALRLTVEWYRAQANGADMRHVSQAQVDRVLTASATAPRQ